MRPCLALFSSLVTILLLAGCGPSEPSGVPSIPEAPATPSQAPAGPAWFEDVTEELGVEFLHLAGTNYFMPDQVGSGIALLDYDNDGRLDLYCVQNEGLDGTARNQLFRQQEDGRFTNVSAGSGVDVAGPGMGAFAGDLNNDGWIDLVVTEYGAVRLFQNRGQGSFVELGPDCGVENPRWAAPASFLDFDRDGWLDLVVGNYVDYDPTHLCYDIQGQRDFCAPKAFRGTVTRLWRNVTGTPGGALRFEEVTESAGLTRSPGAALGLVCADFTGDGWVDIFCSDDGLPNRLFVNGGDGTFTEEAALRGLAFNAMGVTAADMGTAVADVDEDGMFDLFVTHLSEEFHGFWKQGPRGLFMDMVAVSGIQKQAWRGTGFGAVFADFDGDGHEDLAFANGLVRRLMEAQTPVATDVSPWWARYAQRAQVFRNDGLGRFEDLSLANAAFSGEARVGRSLALGDLDRDGAPDLVMGNTGGKVRLYRNSASHPGHWLGLRLLDPAHGQRDAIGAECMVRAGSRQWWGLCQPATSYLVSHQPGLHFGLGAVSKVDQVEVSWPDGSREVFLNPALDQWMELRKGEGQPLTATPK